MEDPWEILGVQSDADRRTIKRAYANALKRIDPDADVEGFQRLRNAYELALDRLTTEAEEPILDDDRRRPASGSSARNDEVHRAAENWDANFEDDGSHSVQLGSERADEASVSTADMVEHMLGSEEPLTVFRTLLNSDFGLDIEYRDTLEWTMIRAFMREECDSRLVGAAYLEFEWHDVYHPIHFYYPEFVWEAEDYANARLARQFVERLSVDPTADAASRAAAARLLTGEGAVGRRALIGLLRDLRERFGEPALEELIVLPEWVSISRQNDPSPVGIVVASLVAVAMLVLYKLGEPAMALAVMLAVIWYLPRRYMALPRLLNRDIK